MNQQYIDPNQIAIVEVVNHRETNYDYIEALTDSMKQVGFSIEYPIDVFMSENIPNHNLDPRTTPYVVACGVHRTLASQSAELDKVFVNIHEGGEEAWIEMMHTDNFQFDPAENRHIGQPFTPKERRAACTQLLMLPKYLELTNTALTELWNTSEANIRRWRKEVSALIECPDKIKEFGISDGRIKRLKEIMGSNERVNASGETVAVRKPREDAVLDDKRRLFEKIYADFPEDLEGFEWGDVKEWAAKKWNVQTGWHMYEDLHIDQLQKLHRFILEGDDGLFTECKQIYLDRKELSALKEDIEKACDITSKMFAKLIGADNKYAEDYKSKWKTFEDMVKSELEIDKFGDTRWDYDLDKGSIQDLGGIVSVHEAVQSAIKNEEAWIAEFMKKEKANAAKKRKKISDRWTETRQAVIDAFENYDRNIEFSRILSEADKNYYKTNGFFAKIFDAESVSEKKNLATLKDEVESMRKVIHAIENNEKWLTEIPEPKPLMSALVEGDIEAKPDADGLSGYSLEDIFQHVADRVISIPGLCDEMEVMVDLAQTLGKAYKGMAGHQLYLIAKQGLFVLAKSSENAEIEKDSSFDEAA